MASASSGTPIELIVQKYGGATLADPEKIKQVAKRISELHMKGKQIVVIVSAMGATTNQLLQLASQISHQPKMRELDMLLSTGERISMSLMSMALNDLGCEAISFTGSQAGILTDSSHFNAFIRDVKAFRVVEALEKNKIVVLAGFQGVSPISKEITTLGRGGSDVTAVAIAANLKAKYCEILKDVPNIFSADPKLIPRAKPLKKLSYDHLLDMTFWGAKVLHYRSVDLAKTKNIPLIIGPAVSAGVISPAISAANSDPTNNIENEGTMIEEVYKDNYESNRILSLNSFETVLKIQISDTDVYSCQKKINQKFDSNQLARPQILQIQKTSNQVTIYLTAPKETLDSFLNKNSGDKIEKLCSVTATCTGTTQSETLEAIFSGLEKIQVVPENTFISARSVILFLPKESRDKVLVALHDLI